jgi:hypothetical protein
MFARTFSVAIVGLALGVLGLQAGGGAKDKKFEVPKTAIAGTVKIVDVKAKKFTITLDDSKARTFSVDEKTVFWGPNGGDRGTGLKGLDDDGMGKGSAIKVVAKTGGKVTKEVYLPKGAGDVAKSATEKNQSATKVAAKTVKKDDEAETPKNNKRYAIPTDAIAGTVKSMDMEAATFTIATDGKSRMFKVDERTEFWGPRGGNRGTGPKGLRDDCMAKGYEIKVVAAKDGKTAKDVHLPTRSRKTSEEKK